MPPMIWMPSCASRRWQSPAAALAVATASSRRLSSSAIVRAAKYAVARAFSRATSMSANLCLIAWNEPVGTPNCPRCLAWSRAMPKTAGQGQCPRRLTACHPAEKPLLLLGRSRLEHGGHELGRGGEEWPGRERAPGLLGQDGELDETEADTAG